MAKFLTTTGVSFHVEQLINKANEKLILISPYLKINDRIKQSLEDKNRMKIDIRVVFGKNQLQPDENNWLNSMQFIRTSFCKDLHAKCYLNETEAIITSMNLYEFSQVNNNEMGIYIEKEKDADIYKDVLEEANRLIRISDEIRISVEKTDKNKKLEKETSVIPKSTSTIKKIPQVTTSSSIGFCIRCGADLKLNPEHPLCFNCYKSWEEYSNPQYQEKFCHICGKESATTYENPVCYSCYKKNK
ncbi:MAG: phospholipase D family protein, partial [Euryarchaeota archaeon]|nr:phospholipase D family protein [Euryarchaeota archaeon]MBU4491519.1 phospholipase D family protein [Euryarchaeota archaeon]